MPWVQAKRYVLVSSSLATTGGPANIATSTGAACTATCTYCPSCQSVLLKKLLSPRQAGEAAGRQAVRSA